MDVKNCASPAKPLVLPEIVALPGEIDVGNSERVGEELSAAFRPGVAVVIADMTRTVFCDSSGIRRLMLARDQAAAVHAELRLAVESKAVLRALEVTGVDGLFKIFPSLEAALTNAIQAQPRADPGPEG